MRGRNLVAGAAAAALAVGAYAVGVSQNAAPATAQTDRSTCGRRTPGAREGPLHRPHAHDHAQPARLEGLRAGEVQADRQPGRRASRTRSPRTASRRRSYTIATDQFGTQLDPPAHWAPEYPAIDELPPTFAVRPLVVISIVDQVKKKGDYHLQVVRHQGVGEGARPDPRGLGGDGPLGLVEEVDDRRRRRPRRWPPTRSSRACR